MVEKRVEATDVDETLSSPGRSASEPLMPEFSTPEPLASGATRKTARIKRGTDDSLEQVKRVRLQYYINKVGHTKKTQDGV